MNNLMEFNQLYNVLKSMLSLLQTKIGDQLLYIVLIYFITGLIAGIAGTLIEYTRYKKTKRTSLEVKKEDEEAGEVKEETQEESVEHEKKVEPEEAEIKKEEKIFNFPAIKFIPEEKKENILTIIKESIKQDIEKNFIKILKHLSIDNIDFGISYLKKPYNLLLYKDYLEKLEKIEESTLDYKFSIDYYLAKVLYYYLLGEYSKIEKILLKAIEVYPDKESFYILLAKYYLYNKKLTEAKVLLDKAEQISPGDDRVINTKIKMAIEEKNYEEGLKLTEKCLLLNRLNIEAYCYRAWIYFELGNITEAEKNIKKALSLNPSHWFPYFTGGLIYYELKRYKDALFYFEKMEKTGYEITFHIPYKLFSYIKTNQKEKARKILSFILDKPVKEIEIIINSLIELEMLDKALDYIEKNKEKISKEKIELYQLKIVERYKQKNNYKNAVKILENIYKQSKNKLEILKEIVSIYKIHIKDKAKVEEYCKKILEIEPEDIDANIKIGRIYFNRKEYKKSLEHYNRIINKPEFIGYPKTYFEIGFSYYKLGNEEKALEFLTIAEKGGYTDINLYNVCGVLYLKREQYIKALGYFEKVISLDPFNASAYNNSGIIYMKLKRYSDAIKNFKKALQIDPDNREILNNLQKAYRELINKESEEYLKQFDMVVKK